MPTIPLPAITVPAALTIITGKSTSKGGTDNFDALLNIGSADKNVPENNDNQQVADDNSRKDDDSTSSTPIAAHIDAPFHLADTNPLPRAPALNTQKTDLRSPSPRDQDDNQGNAPATTDNTQRAKPLLAAGKKLAAAKDSNSSDTAQANSDTADTSNAPAAEAPNNTIAASQAAPATADDTLTPKLSEQLQKISDILAGVLQSLGNTATANPVTTATAAITTDTTAAVTMPATPAQPTDTASLLKNIQTVLQQVQQLVAAETTPGAATPANLPALTDTLAKSVDQLTQLLQAPSTPQPGTAIAAAATPADMIKSLLDKTNATVQITPAAQPATTEAPAIQPELSLASNIKEVLKTTISQIKDQLQKLKTGEPDANQQTAQPSPDVTLPAKDGLAFKPLLAKQAMDGNAIAVNSGAVTAPLPDNTITAPTSNSTPVAAAVTPALSADLSQEGDTDSGSNSNQGQSTPAPVVTAGLPGTATSSTAATPSAFDRALSQVSQASLHDQVAFHVGTALNDGSSKIHIRLDPEELGKLDIKLTVGADGKTSVVITADNKNTLDLMQRDMQGLTGALNDAGLQTDSGNLSFNLRGGQDQGQGQGQGRAQAAFSYQKSQPDEEDTLAINPINSSYVVNLAEGLDIKI